MPNQLEVIRTVLVEESEDANQGFESLLVDWRLHFPQKGRS